MKRRRKNAGEAQEKDEDVPAIGNDRRTAGRGARSRRWAQSDGLIAAGSPTTAVEKTTAPRRSTVVNLKCPACLHESALDELLPLDASITCASCGKPHEFRELHEAWCRSKRSALAEAFPELSWPTTATEARQTDDHGLLAGNDNVLEHPGRRPRS